MDRRPLLGWGGPEDALEEDCVLTPYEYPSRGESHRRDRGQPPRGYRYYTEERPERRHSSSSIAKLFLVCIVMISFCLLMYIPVYNKVNKKLVTVSGWGAESNRDTRVYVQPGNTTLVHDARGVCAEPLFLLVVVCSSAANFRERQVIRDTWANYSNYLEIVRVTKSAKNTLETESIREMENRLKNDVHITESLDFPNITLDNSIAAKNRREIFNFKNMMPHLAAALKKNVKNDKREETTEESRFEEAEQKALPEFNMDNVLGDDKAEEFDYEEESNVMKIPPRGSEDSPDLNKVINMLKKSDMFKVEGSNPKISDIDNKVDSNKFSENKIRGSDKQLAKFKVLFLLGLPWGENDTTVQSSIDEEANKFGDIIQESFVDSYNNLTLKSIMMLKWIVTHCEDKVRYVLKTDDDVYVNVPRLAELAERRAAEGDARREYYIMGHVIHNARPVSDVSSKWYTPRYMFAGRTYPRYLSGTGYVLTGAAVAPLYRAALTTPLFHLEDIFITGMCSMRARPPLRPRGEPGFKYYLGVSATDPACDVYQRITVHRASAELMRILTRSYVDPEIVTRCERKYSAQSKREAHTRKWLGRMMGSEQADAAESARLSMLGRLNNVLDVRKVFFRSGR